MKKPNQLKAIIVATLLAPLFGTIIGYNLLPSKTYSAIEAIGAQPLAMLTISIFNYSATIIYGLPAHFILRKNKTTDNSTTYMIFGGISGTVFILILYVFSDANDSLDMKKAIYLIAAIVGAFVAFLFRFIVGPYANQKQNEHKFEN